MKRASGKAADFRDGLPIRQKTGRGKLVFREMRLAQTRPVNSGRSTGATHSEGIRWSGDRTANLWHSIGMRFWRAVTEDRHSGGLLGVLLALSFAVQVLVAGWTTAAMAAPDPLSVLCTSSPDGLDRPAGPQSHHACPCSQLCGAGVLLLTGPVPSDGLGIPIRFADRIEIPVPPSTGRAAMAGVRQYHARAPPLASN